MLGLLTTPLRLFPRGVNRWLVTFGATGVISLATASDCRAEAIYGGTTEKGELALEPIVVRADGPSGLVKSVVVAWEANCSDGSTVPFSADLVVRPETPGFGPDPGTLAVDRNEQGRFSGRAARVSFGADGRTISSTMVVEGTLVTLQGKGTLSGEATVQPPSGAEPISCSTGKITWQAARSQWRGRRVYGGVTAQGEPVVVRVDSRRPRVVDLIFGWDTISCAPAGGPFRLGDWVSNFRLRAGVFRARFRESYPREDGVSKYSYRLFGRVRPSAASGTVNVSWTRIFTDGTPTRTCRTGSVRWNATFA